MNKAPNKIAQPQVARVVKGRVGRRLAIRFGEVGSKREKDLLELLVYWKLAKLS